VLADDTANPDGGPVAVPAAAPADGTAAVDADGLITYAPAAGFVGDDVSTRRIADGRGGFATPTVAVKARQFGSGLDRGGPDRPAAEPRPVGSVHHHPVRRAAAFVGRPAGAAGAAGPVELFGDFFAFEPELRNGVFLAGGDLTGDGLAELIAGGGPGGGPRVRAFDGKALVQTGSQVDAARFVVSGPSRRGGVRVAVKDLDGDDLADLVVGAGPCGGSRVTAYAGKSIRPNRTPQELFGFDAQPGFAGGVFVG